MNKIEPEIVYEDDEILVCHKPGGIATQTKRLGQQDMESLLKNYRAQKGEPPYIGVVHRLDQPVEGVMVFAKTPRAASDLSRQVRQRDFGKHYLAIAPVAQGKKSAGVLIDYLVTDKKNNVTKVVEKGTAQAQLAKLEYKMIGQTRITGCESQSAGQTQMAKQGNSLASGAKTSDSEREQALALYDILLHTGRHHQIRVQFAHMGCPLFGDTKYGAPEEKTALALCSYRVEFSHPTSGKRMDFSIKPKNELFRMFEKG
jgi:23S rRNA pseudouridine1911/1915/1917 synthase